MLLKKNWTKKLDRIMINYIDRKNDLTWIRSVKKTPIIVYKINMNEFLMRSA